MFLQSAAVASSSLVGGIFLGVLVMHGSGKKEDVQLPPVHINTVLCQSFIRHTREARYLQQKYDQVSLSDYDPEEYNRNKREIAANEAAMDKSCLDDGDDDREGPY